MSEKDKLIEFIKTDGTLKDKMEKMCFAIGYATYNDKLTKEDTLDVLQKIIYNEI